MADLTWPDAFTVFTVVFGGIVVVGVIQTIALVLAALVSRRIKP